MRKLALPLLVLVLASFASTQTTTTIHNQGGNYDYFAWEGTETFAVDTVDGQAVQGSVTLNYPWGGILDIKTPNFSVQCTGPVTSNPSPLPPVVGAQFTLTWNLSCSDGSTGSSVQQSQVYTVVRCGGRGSHPCPYSKSLGGNTVLTK